MSCGNVHVCPRLNVQRKFITTGFSRSSGFRFSWKFLALDIFCNLCAYCVNTVFALVFCVTFGILLTPLSKAAYAKKN